MKRNSLITKLLIISIFCMLSLHSLAQRISIGQNATTVKIIVENEVKSYYRAQGYHQVKMESDTKYTNGTISEVILCKSNVPAIDLGRAADFCTRYVMNNAVLDHILVQYQNVSLEELQNLAGKKAVKIGDYYFEDDFTKYSRVYIATNGLVTKADFGSDFNRLPAIIKSQVANASRSNLASENAQVEDYPDFIPMEKRIIWIEKTGKTGRGKIDETLIKNSSPAIKAILSYYSSSFRSFSPFTSALGYTQCSFEQRKFLYKWFPNNIEIASTIENCGQRSIDNQNAFFVLNRLEYKENENRVWVSFSFSVVENGTYEETVVGVDEFAINGNSIIVQKLSSKESPKKLKEEVLKKVYSIEEEDPIAFQKFINDIRKDLIRQLEESDIVPSFTSIIAKMDRPDYTGYEKFSNNYKLSYETEDHSREGRMVGNAWIAGNTDIRLARNYELNEGTDSGFSLLKNSRVYIPSISINGINVTQKRISLNDIGVDFTRGIAVVQIKKDLQFIKYSPSDDLKLKIKEKLEGSPKGVYLVKYQVGNVMGDKIETLEHQQIKKESSLGEKLLKGGIMGLLLQ